MDKMCINFIFVIFTMFSISKPQMFVSSEGIPKPIIEGLKVTNTYINANNKLCVEAMLRFHENRRYECILENGIQYETVLDSEENTDNQITACKNFAFDGDNAKDVSLSCFSKATSKLETALIYKQGLEPEILRKQYSTGEVPMFIVTLKSNPFFFWWELNNTSLTPDDSHDSIIVTAFKQTLTDTFTYSVVLMFYNDTKFLKYEYKLVLKYGNKKYHQFTFRNIKNESIITDLDPLYDNISNISEPSNLLGNNDYDQPSNIAPVFESTTVSPIQSINQYRNQSLCEYNEYFQTSTFFYGLGAGLVAAFLLFVLLRVTVCPPPKRPRSRMPTPAPEDDYSQVYSWRRTT